MSDSDNLTDSENPNPFAPPVAHRDADLLRRPSEFWQADPAPKRRSWWYSLGVWTLICSVSAAPSFAWGMGTIATHQWFAMCLGIAMFIAAYTVGDQLTQGQPWRCRKPVRLAMKIGYGTRLLISIIFPLGASLDLVCGMFSASMASLLTRPILPSTRGEPLVGEADFLTCLLTTLIQGTVLNVVLLGYTSLVLGLVLAIQAFTARDQAWPSQDPPAPTE